jgi:hypothetical protein
VDKLGDWPIEANPGVEDPSYVGGESTRAFVATPPG